MTQTQLDAILEEHAIPEADRPAFRTLVDVGVILQPGFSKKARGAYKRCLEAVMRELSKPILEKHGLVN